MDDLPEVKIDKHDPLQDWYGDIDGPRWSVARLVDAAKDLPVFDCPLASIDLSRCIWDGCCIQELAEHCKRVFDADLDRPILFDWYGNIADGRHRVIKALIEGRRTIKAKRLMVRPIPCREGS